MRNPSGFSAASVALSETQHPGTAGLSRALTPAGTGSPQEEVSAALPVSPVRTKVPVRAMGRILRVGWAGGRIFPRKKFAGCGRSMGWQIPTADFIPAVRGNRRLQ